MKIFPQDKENFVLRFDKGEEVIQGLVKFMQQEGVDACSFFGIGAASELEIGIFVEQNKNYQKQAFQESLEILSISGNGGLLNSQPAIHAHGVFGRNDFSTIGGHVFKLITLATCEIFLTKLAGALERKNNPDFNLNLLA